MHRAAQALLGEHDFSAFRTVHCQAPHARRDLQHIAVTREGDIVEVEVQAKRVPSPYGATLWVAWLPVGRGERPAEWLAESLAAGDRTVAGPTAPPDGLVFVGPRYPAGSAPSRGDVVTATPPTTIMSPNGWFFCTRT